MKSLRCDIVTFEKPYPSPLSLLSSFSSPSSIFFSLYKKGRETSQRHINNTIKQLSQFEMSQNVTQMSQVASTRGVGR